MVGGGAGRVDSAARRHAHCQTDAARAAASSAAPASRTSACAMVCLGRISPTQALAQVLRAPMTDEERDVFLRCARQLVGTRYDIARCVFADCSGSTRLGLMSVRWWIARAFELVLRLALKHITGSSPLRKLPISVDPNSWICSDAIMYGLSAALSLDDACSLQLTQCGVV